MSDIYLGGPATLTFTVAAADSAGSTSIHLLIRAPAGSGADDLDKEATLDSGEKYRVSLTIAEIAAGGLGEWLATVETRGEDATIFPKYNADGAWSFEVISPWMKAA
jgi:hypothetical protein